MCILFFTGVALSHCVFISHCDATFPNNFIQEDYVHITETIKSTPDTIIFRPFFSAPYNVFSSIKKKIRIVYFLVRCNISRNERNRRRKTGDTFLAEGNEFPFLNVAHTTTPKFERRTIMKNI